MIQILRKWWERRLHPIGMFVRKLRRWQQAGYVGEDVWTELNAVVNLESLSDENDGFAEG